MLDALRVRRALKPKLTDRVNLRRAMSVAKHSRMIRTFISLATSVFFVAFLASAQVVTQPLVIETDEGSHSFVVEMADEPEEISRGLMDRTEMAPDAGMIFDFGVPREASMWMKNTILPLDMLFLQPDGHIVAIARNTVPGSLAQINPGVPVKGVLELNAGRSAELGIEPGDTVRHEMFGNMTDAAQPAE